MSSLACSRSNTEAAARLPLDMSDDSAIAEVLRGNREMFEVIVRRYNPQLYRVGMAYLRNHAQTEDAMQNAYVKAFLNLSRFRATSAFATWLTRIMINECLMTLRSKRRVTLEPLDDQIPEPDSTVAPIGASLLQEEKKAVLQQAIQQLPRAHRAVYLMREIQQLSTAETAQCLGISPENVKVTLHRAREGLKTQVLKSAAGIELFSYPARFCDPMTARVMHAIAVAQPA